MMLVAAHSVARAEGPTEPEVDGEPKVGCKVIWVDESMADFRQPFRSAGDSTPVLFINRCVGGATYTPGYEDSRQNSSSIIDFTGTLPEFSYSDEVWQEMLAETRDILGGYDLVITDVDPGDEPHHEVPVCGSPWMLGFDPLSVGGVSPMWCYPIENSISYVFPSQYGGNPRRLGEVIAHEAGHAFGLDHEYLCEDLMTYLGGCGDKYYVDANAICGEDAARDCYCARFRQNSHQWLLQVFGPADPSPPEVTITEPADGARVEESFRILAEVTDEQHVGWARLYIDGLAVATIHQPDYYFTAPFDVTRGRHQIEVRATDRLGNIGSTSITVELGEPCAAPADCNLDETCVDGHCVRGPGVVGGLGEACQTGEECDSGLCGEDGSGTKVCIEVCLLGERGCPEGFTCSAAGDLGGVCWPLESDDGGGCSVGRSRSPSPAWLLLLLALWPTRRCWRRRQDVAR